MNGRRLARTLASVVAPFAAAAAVVAASSGPVLPDPGNAGISKADQQKLGQQVVAQVYKEMPVLPDSSPETQYIRQLGERLASVIPPQNSWPWEFHVVPQKEINAFAVPGGPMFVNLGTLVAAQNEAQLAGVMAHEMAHVYMQHSAKQMRKNQAPGLLAGIGQIAGQVMGGVGGALTGQLTKIGSGMWSMKYSRTDEAEADAVGAIIMYNAGYDPHALADFFKALGAQGGAPPQILSDHPNPGNRETAIDRQIATWPAKSFVTTSAAFTRAQERAKTVRLYTAQEIESGAKSGLWARQNASGGVGLPATAATVSPAAAVAGGPAPTADYQKVKPSGLFRPLTHGSISLFYPENWQVYGRETDSGVTVAPAAGVVEGNIAYGVIVNRGRDTRARTLDDTARDVVAAMQRSNPKLRALGASRAVTVDGLAGVSLDLQSESPLRSGDRPLPERVWLVLFRDSTVEGGFVYLAFISPEADFDQLRPTYEMMLRGASLQQ
jgi:Zn-dependent protease with chaperone function